MKKSLVLLLLVAVLTVSARRSRKPGKHGPSKPNQGCQVSNCKNCHSKPYLCDECDNGFVRVKVPLGYACVKKQDCTQNCKTCQHRSSCSVCEHGHVLYKGFTGVGIGRCMKKCPRGYKTELNPMGGNKCVKQCTPNCETCLGRSCSVCERGYALYKRFARWGSGSCVEKCPKGYKTEVNPSGGNKCVRQCTPNCKKCQSRFSCSICEHGHALYKGYSGMGVGRCMKKCPRGFKTEVNPMGGNKCVKPCTPNCKTCQRRSCSVCEHGYALHKSFSRWDNGRCVQRCPNGYKARVNPSGGNKCARQCKVKECESCPITWVPQQKCTKCNPGYYKLTVGKPWQQGDLCFSHCPAGYVPKIVKGVAVCQIKPETTTEEPTPEPEWTTAEPEPMTSDEPTTEPDYWTTPEPDTTPEPSTEPEPTTTEEPTTEPDIYTTTEQTTTPEPMTEPEPTTIFTDFWP